MTTIELRGVSRWYGNVVAVNDVTMTIGPGVTGLLGPNGAGKSTLLHLMAGFGEPSRGELTVGGSARLAEAGRLHHARPGPRGGLGLRLPHRGAVRPRQRPAAPAARPRGRGPAGHRDGGHGGPEEPADQHLLQGHAAAHPGRRRPGPRAGGAAPGRAVQRHGSPAAPAHDGPAATRSATAGRTIVFSSHILEEVARVSGTIQVMVAGRLAASGDFRAIRRLMTSRPHVFLVRSVRRPPARRRPHRPPGGQRGRADRRRPAGAGLRLRRVHQRDCRADPGPRASGCANCCPPTSRWKASSPTWSPHAGPPAR